MKEVCPQGQALAVVNLDPLPVCALCFVSAVEGILTASGSPHLPLAAQCDGLLPLEPRAKINSLFLKLPLLMTVYQSNRKATNTAP